MPAWWAEAHPMWVQCSRRLTSPVTAPLDAYQIRNAHKKALPPWPRPTKMRAFLWVPGGRVGMGAAKKRAATKPNIVVSNRNETRWRAEGSTDSTAKLANRIISVWNDYNHTAWRIFALYQDQSQKNKTTFAGVDFNPRQPHDFCELKLALRQVVFGFRLIFLFAERRPECAGRWVRFLSASTIRLDG